MPEIIDRERVRELIAQGAQVLDVLPTEEYEEAHLPGALNVPLKQLDARSAAALDPARPVVCYCFDFQ